MFKTEAIWNNMQLERPPNAVWQVEARKFDTSMFLSTIDKIVKDLNSQEMLHTEAAILSRLIYRMKSKFRNDKGLKNMGKVNKALLKYLSLSLDKEYKNLKSYVELDGEFVSLPSRQMVEHVLVKTQGFAKLMVRVEEVARHCAYFFKSRMHLGHAWSISVIAYSVISRIWILSRHLIKDSCSWYNNLYGHLKSFRLLGIPWLPITYDLPSDLKLWLSLPWINDAIPSIPSNEQLKDTMFKLITVHESDSDVDLDIKQDDNDLEIISPSLPIHRQYEVPNKEANDTNASIISVVDTGEIISRRTFGLKRVVEKSNKISPNKRKYADAIEQEERHKKTTCLKESEQGEEGNVKETSSRHARNKSNKRRNTDFISKSNSPLTFDNVKSMSELKLILNKESYPGLDKLQWNMIRNKSKKLVNELNTCSDKQAVLLKKAVQRMRRWIT